MEYVLADGTAVGNSVVISGITHSKQAFGNLSELIEVAVPPVLTANQTMDWTSGSVVGGKWQRFTVRNKSNAELNVEIRSTRDSLLTATDFYALSDVTMSNDMTTYRQALRDLPANVDLTNIVYPTKP